MEHTRPLEGGVISDGYLTASNYYDGHLYVFGKDKAQLQFQHHKHK